MGALRRGWTSGLVAAAAGPLSLASGFVPGSEPVTLPLLMHPEARVLTVAQPPVGTTDAAVSGLATLDFNDDGRLDVAVAWYHSDVFDPSTRSRKLTIYVSGGAGSLTRLVDIDLYNPDPDNGIFLNGTGGLVKGDFDGDGDTDLAVLPYFGDELWLIENLPGSAYAKHAKFPFGINGFGNFITPPEGVAADFDGDGRADLAYVTDPTQRIDALDVHFWRTHGSIQGMYRAPWEADAGSAALKSTRALSAGDYDGDGRPDLAISGTAGLNGPPVIAIWHNLNLAAAQFKRHEFYPGFLVSDLISIPRPGRVAHIVAGDLESAATLTRYQPRLAGQQMSVTEVGYFVGLAGVAGGRGTALAVADMTGDGTRDVVARQRCGIASDPVQIEVVRSDVDGPTFVATPPFTSTDGITDACTNEILRPLNVEAADLFGSPLPEIIAAFRPDANPPAPAPLTVMVWTNGCIGDTDGDADVDFDDILVVVAANGCAGSAGYVAAADIDRDGCVDFDDLLIVFQNFGCRVD